MYVSKNLLKKECKTVCAKRRYLRTRNFNDRSNGHTKKIKKKEEEKEKGKTGPTKVGMTYFVVNWHRWRSATKKSRMVNTNDSSSHSMEELNEVKV